MPDLVYECEELHKIVGVPVLHELGANTPITGSVEHPKLFAKRLLLTSQVSDLHAQVVQPNQEIELWTDGSVLKIHQFCLTTAAYAIVDADNQVLEKGLVNRLHCHAYAAYAPELFAVLQARVQTFRVHIFGDCKAVVEQATIVLSGLTGVAKSGGFRERSTIHPQPFSISWIPAHKLEHLPISKVWLQRMAQL